jgi:hypothetical protein
MMDAIAGALVLGGVNTIADVVAAQLKLGAAGIYPVGRILLACYCVGGLIGLQSRQLLIGTLSGLMLGTLVGGLYVVLAPSLGAGAAWLAWAAFWLGFAGCEAVLRGESGPVSAAIQGVGAAALSGTVYYGISGSWIETAASDPSILRAGVLWTATFVAGFVPLFWRRAE